MSRITVQLASTAILALTAVSVHAQNGDVAAGHAFARETCNACHIVEAKQQKPRLIVVGPAFCQYPRLTPTALRVFLTTSHPKMPNLILSPEEISDVTAYIVSLRHRPPPD